MKNRHEINLLTINHADTNLSEDIRILLYLIKYHYLDFNRIHPNISEMSLINKEYLTKLINQFKERGPFELNEDYSLLPFDKNSKYYYHLIKKKIYDFYTDIRVKSDYIYFGMLFVFKLMYTEDELIDDFLNHHLSSNFNNNPDLLKQKADFWFKTYSIINVKKYFSLIEPDSNFQLVFFDFNETQTYLKIIDSWYKNQSENLKLKFSDYIKRLASLPEQRYVGTVFPKDYFPFIELYEKHWNYSSKIDWVLPDWYLYYYIEFFIDKFDFQVSKDLIYEYICKFFTYKRNPFVKRNLQTRVKQAKKSNKFPDFIEILSSSFTIIQ